MEIQILVGGESLRVLSQMFFEALIRFENLSQLLTTPLLHLARNDKKYLRSDKTQSIAKKMYKNFIENYATFSRRFLLFFAARFLRRSMMN